MTEGLVFDEFGYFNWSSNMTENYYQDNSLESLINSLSSNLGSLSNAVSNAAGMATSAASAVSAATTSFDYPDYSNYFNETDYSNSTDSNWGYDSYELHYENAYLYLWKDQAENNWVWSNPDDGSIVYEQIYRPDLRKTLALYVEGGI
jgi:hypothetical protein